MTSGPTNIRNTLEHPQGSFATLGWKSSPRWGDGIPTAPPAEAPPFVLYVAGPIELVGGLLLIAGLFTRWTAFICSGLMAAAYWMAHGLNHALPILNRGELAALYCFVFLYIAANGAGPFSIDASRGDD